MKNNINNIQSSGSFNMLQVLLMPMCRGAV
jgi:hypothetical protein